MARAFTSASSHYLENASAVLTGVPISMAAWFKTGSLAEQQVILALVNSASTVSQNSFALYLAGLTGGDPVGAWTATTSGVSATTSVGFSTGVWQHAAAVFSATNARAVYLNGGSKGTNATDRTPTGINRTNLGLWRQATSVSAMSGDLAEAAIWDVALTDDDVASLADGFSPLLIRPTSLVAYWPLIGKFDPEIDPVGKFDMTVSGAVVGNHPRIIYPRARQIYFALAAGHPAVKRMGGIPFAHSLGYGVW